MDLLNSLSVPRGDHRYATKRHPVVCLPSDVVGSPVFVSGEPVGGSLTVESADPSDPGKMPSIGILESKTSDTVGVVFTFGSLSGVYTGLSVGREYYVVSGGVSLTPPPGDAQVIGVSLSSNVLYLPGSLGGGGGGGSVEYDTIVEDLSASSFFVGRTPVGGVESDPVWQIKKVVDDPVTGAVFYYADGSVAYDKVWDDREDYVYG